MKYVTGIYALNLSCSLETCGDWRQSALPWDKMTLAESDGSVYGDYGIEKNKWVPCHKELYNAANHIRAILDLIVGGNFIPAQGMNDDFIVVDIYNDEIFEKVCELRRMEHWPDIDYFMTFEYRGAWLDYKKRHSVRPVVPDIKRVRNKYMLSWRKEDDEEKDFLPELAAKYGNVSDEIKCAPMSVRNGNI